MKKENPLRDKSYAFALKSVKLCFQIQEDRKEFFLTKQFLKSATSIGANVEEAIGGQSEKDFVHKLAIAYKEARESNYWIRLMSDSNLIEDTTKMELYENSEEIMKIIGSIQKTMKSKQHT